MFTGIVTDLGEIVQTERRADRGLRFTVASHYDPASIAIGASIAHDGVCLTVIEILGNGSHVIEVSEETLSKTTLGDWTAGTRVNLERPLCLGDELGGHLVSGHVDGVATVLSVQPDGASWRYRFRVPDPLARYIAPKGSAAINGVSLTVNEVDGADFGVNIIPHTREVTSFGTLSAGDRVNVEIDLLARYVARLMGGSIS